MTGSTLSAAALPIGTDTDVSTNGTYLYVFNQQNGSDISQSPWYESTWATESLVGKRDLQDWNLHNIDVQLPLESDTGQMTVTLPEVTQRRNGVGAAVGQGSLSRGLDIYSAMCRHLDNFRYCVYINNGVHR